MTNTTLPEYFVPDSDGLAVFLGIMGMVAWGSWANLLKFNEGKTRFEFFFLDYQAGAFFSSLLLTVILGTSGFFDGLTFGRILAAAAAGVFNTLGTLLVMASVELSGMTVVFPIVVGIEMTIGTTMLWAIEQKEDPSLLFTGVGCAMCAVVLDYLSHAEARDVDELGGSARRGSETNSLSYTTLMVTEKDFSTDISDLSRPYTFSSHRQDNDNGIGIGSGSGRTGGKYGGSGGGGVPCMSFMDAWELKSRGLFLCVLAAVFFSLWPVLDALSTEGCANEMHASPYAFFFFFRMSALAFTWSISSCMSGLSPGKGSAADDVEVTFHNYMFEIPTRSRLLGLAAGFIWGFGTLCSLVSGEVVGLSVSVTITRCSPLVATFWGVVLWKETRDMNNRGKKFLIAMVLMYCCAIAFVAASAPSDDVPNGEAGNC
jgi:glucose uptake protein GlcU